MGPSREEQKKSFIKEGLMLHQSLSLCSSIVPKNMQAEANFFEAVRVQIMRFLYGRGDKKFSLKEVNERINELLKQSVKSDGVLNLFSDVGEKFSLFDPKFLENIAKMKQKNIAVDKEAAFSGEKLGLTKEEVAFYDALTKPEAAKDFYSNDQLVAMTRELTELLRKNRTIDWQRKESARANMRRLIKRLLKKYKYPPEGQEAALKTVISQCEMWTDNMDFEDVGEKCADNQVYFAPGEDVREYRIAAENQSNAYRVE